MNPAKRSLPIAAPAVKPAVANDPSVRHLKFKRFERKPMGEPVKTFATSGCLGQELGFLWRLTGFADRDVGRICSCEVCCELASFTFVAFNNICGCSDCQSARAVAAGHRLRHRDLKPEWARAQLRRAA